MIIGLKRDYSKGALAKGIGITAQNPKLNTKVLCGYGNAAGRPALIFLYCQNDNFSFTINILGSIKKLPATEH